MFITYCFLRYIHEGYLSLAHADNKQSNFATELKNFPIKYLDKLSIFEPTFASVFQPVYELTSEITKVTKAIN